MLNTMGVAFNWEKGADLLANIKQYGQLADVGTDVLKPGSVFKTGADMFAGSNWKNLLLGAGDAGKASPAFSRTASVIGGVGKAFGVLGVGIGAWNTYNDFASGNYERGAYDAVNWVKSWF